MGVDGVVEGRKGARDGRRVGVDGGLYIYIYRENYRDTSNLQPD